MANAVYNLGKEALLTAGIDWTNDDIKCDILDATYTVNLSTDDFHSVVTASGSIIATSGNFTSKTTTDGIADAADVTFTSVAAGSTVTYIVIWKDSGLDSTSQLIAYIDTATGMPVATDGNNINILWDNGVDKIFAI